MRVGVLSDTHGAIKEAARVIENMGDINALIHAGDFYVDALYLRSVSKVPVHAVAGNCDSFSGGNGEMTVDMGGHRVYITHGHLFRVKQGMQALFYRVREVGAEIVVFGHTHIPLNLWEDDTLFFNPGSISFPQPGHAAGYGILEIAETGIEGKLFAI